MFILNLIPATHFSWDGDNKMLDTLGYDKENKRRNVSQLIRVTVNMIGYEKEHPRE